MENGVNMKVIFSHGKESGPWGSKITQLANIAKAAGCSVDSIDYSNIASPDERVIKLNTTLSNIEIVHGWSDDIVPVASSIKYAQQTQRTLHLIDGDHRLNSSITQVIALFESFLLATKTHHG